MTDLILSIQGTPTGAFVAALLALTAAIAHAVFGALQKGRYDPWIARGALDAGYGLLALPFALFAFPLPDADFALIFVGVFAIHLIYKVLMARSYELGAYTFVYPIVRGTGPLVTVIAAGIVFDEHFEPMQWAGVLALSSGIFALAVVNLRTAHLDRRTVYAALGFALACGVSAAAYTTYDAWGIRISENPFMFLVWFFVVDGLSLFPWLAIYRWRTRPQSAPLRPLLWRGLIGGAIGMVSFGCVMMATRLDKVGEAAVLRETSTVFAALIGWLFLKEKVGPLRGGLMAFIALGAILVEFG